MRYFCVSDLGGFYTEGLIFGILRYVNNVKVCQVASKISTSPRQISLQSKAFVWGKGKTFERKINLFNSVKDKSKIQVADKVTGNLTASREQITESEKLYKV